MNRQTFNALLKDLVPQLYDITVVETHPLTAAIDPPTSYRGSRGEYVQKLVTEAIEKLKPLSRSSNLSSPEWRPYQILRGRYVQGNSPQELAAQLALSERQLRRDHSRALQALAERLYQQLFPGQADTSAAPSALEESSLQGFEINLEPLDLTQVLQGVLVTLQARSQAEGIQLQLARLDIPKPVLADRIILRQILLSLISYAFHLQANRKVQVSASTQANQASVLIQINVDENWALLDDDERQDLLETARHWGKQINLTIRQTNPPRGQAGELILKLNLPSAAFATVMVVDDQQPTLRMYQRYLSRTNLDVLGVTDPVQALPLARQWQPVLILLDVMMPHVDGWEILQVLRTDAHTQHIPVVVCSAWEASDLARSLGAADFLKKPITQRDLLETIQRLKIAF